jgi:hypothetical protein
MKDRDCLIRHVRRTRSVSHEYTSFSDSEDSAYDCLYLSREESLCITHLPSRAFLRHPLPQRLPQSPRPGPPHPSRPREIFPGLHHLCYHLGRACLFANYRHTRLHRTSIDHAPLKAESEEIKPNLGDDVVVEATETGPAVPNRIARSDSARPLIPLSEDPNQPAMDTLMTTLPPQDVKPLTPGPVLASGALANTGGREHAAEVEPAGDTQPSPSASNSRIQLPTAQQVSGTVPATPSAATMTRDEHVAFTIIQSEHVTDEARDAAEELVTFLLRRALREQANADSASTAPGNALDNAVPWEEIHEYALNIQLSSNSNGRLVKQVAGEVLANRFRRRLEQLQTST